MYVENRIPGPGQYENVTGLTGSGKSLVSENKGGSIGKFSKDKRVTKFDESRKDGLTRPGPGAYRSISEFGNYDGNVYESGK